MEKITPKQIKEFISSNPAIAEIIATCGIQITQNDKGKLNVEVIVGGAGGGTDPLSASATAKTGVQNLQKALNELEFPLDELPTTIKQKLISALEKPTYVTFSTKHMDSEGDLEAIVKNSKFVTIGKKKLKVEITNKKGEPSFIGLVKLNKSEVPKYPEADGYTKDKNYKRMTAEYAIDGDVYMFCYPRDLDPLSIEAMEFYGMLHEWAKEKNLDQLPLIDTGADIYGFSEHDDHEKNWEIPGDNKHLISLMAMIHGPDFIQQLSFTRFNKEDGSVLDLSKIYKARNMMQKKTSIFVNAVGFGLDGQVRGAAMNLLLKKLASDDIKKTPLSPEYFVNLYVVAKKSGEIKTETRTTTQLSFLGLAFAGIPVEQREAKVEALQNADEDSKQDAIEAFLKEGFDKEYEEPQAGMRNALKEYLTDTLNRNGLQIVAHVVRYTPNKRTQNSSRGADKAGSTPIEDKSIPIEHILTEFRVPDNHPLILHATAKAMRARNKQAQKDEIKELRQLSGAIAVGPEKLGKLQETYKNHENTWAKKAREQKQNSNTVAGKQ